MNMLVCFEHAHPNIKKGKGEKEKGQLTNKQDEDQTHPA